MLQLIPLKAKKLRVPIVRVVLANQNVTTDIAPSQKARRVPVTRIVSANKNVSNDIVRRVAVMFGSQAKKNSNGAKDCWVPNNNKTFKIGNGAFNEDERQKTQSKEADYSSECQNRTQNHRAFHQSTQHHVVVRPKTCRTSTKDRMLYKLRSSFRSLL